MLADILYDSLPPTVFLTREEYVRSLEEWTLQAIENDGQLAFIIMTKGPEFHFHSCQTGARIPLDTVRRIIGEQVAQYGYATTRTPKDDERQHKVNRLFGWEKVDEDRFDVHYRIERVRPCRQ